MKESMLNPKDVFDTLTSLLLILKHGDMIIVVDRNNGEVEYSTYDEAGIDLRCLVVAISKYLED